MILCRFGARDWSRSKAAPEGKGLALMSRLSKVGVPLCLTALLLLDSSPASPHYPITTTVVFNREVAAILNQKCSQCHVTDGMAMPLQTYAQARPWAVAIKEEIL